MCETQTDEEGGQGTGGGSGESNRSAIPIEDAGIQEGCGMLFIVLSLFLYARTHLIPSFPVGWKKESASFAHWNTIRSCNAKRTVIVIHSFLIKNPYSLKEYL